MGIRALARELNLSIGTVSRALNDRPDVNDETRARVKEAALRTGYVPDQSGRSLRKRQTGIVAVVIPSSGFGVHSDGGLFQILEGCRRRLSENGLDLIVIFSGPEEDPLANLKRIVSRRMADAIIINQVHRQDPRLAYLSESDVRHVTLGQGIDRTPDSWVDFDYESVAIESARLFLHDGHRRIGIVVSNLEVHFEEILINTLRGEVIRQGLPAETTQVLHTDGTRLTDEGRAVFSGSNIPTALLAAHESIAATLHAELAGRGIHVGTDIALISGSPVIDNRAALPGLTHFDADLTLAGQALAERLLALLRDPLEGPIELPPALIPMQLTKRTSHVTAPRICP